MNTISLYFDTNYITCGYTQKIKPLLYKKYKYQDNELYNGIIFNIPKIIYDIMSFIKICKLYDNMQAVTLILCFPDNHVIENSPNPDPIFYSTQEEKIFDDKLYVASIRHEIILQYHIISNMLSEKIAFKNYIFTTKFLAFYNLFKHYNNVSINKPFNILKEELKMFCLQENLSIEQGLHLIGNSYESY